MKHNLPTAFLSLTAALALCACGDTLPAGSTPRQTASVVTTAPVVGSVPVVTTTAPGSPPVITSTAPVVTTATVMPTRLSADATAALITGNTATGYTANGQVYYAYFRNDGRFQYVSGRYRDEGAWHVAPDGSLCSRLYKTNSGAEECYTLYRDGTNVQFDRPDGTKVGTFTVMPGNARNLY